MDLLSNLQPQPNAVLALSRYREMAPSYELSCRRIELLRALAIEKLALTPGETVIDVACGTGVTTATLARAVGGAGCVVGIELSPQMAALARQRLDAAGLVQARIEVAAVHQARVVERADAFLFSFTHDVLQQSEALDALVRMAKPGARYAVLGMRTLPWWRGWRVNLFVMWRARHYLTTFHGLAAPWVRLEAVSREFKLVGTWHAGTTYMALGTFA
jgi:demethylmenaquinone methyltransferase/2-methoxy-6-polyprenyl-1,4-benzoquinol methylase